MLGSAIYRSLASTKAFEIVGLGRQPQSAHTGLYTYLAGDLRDDDFMAELAEITPVQWIIHCAAFVDLKYCQENFEATNKLHAIATAALSQLFPAATFVYISTDSVFDGKLGNYSEEDTAAPPNFYALTKYHGEGSVVMHTPNHYILRTNIYGFNTPAKGSLFEWAYRSLSQNQIITGFDNFIFNPLYVGQVAEIIQAFMSKPIPYGVYHLGCDQALSKYEFLEIVKRKFSRSGEIQRKMGDPHAGGISRPENTSLDTQKLKRILNLSQLSLVDGLRMLEDDLAAHNPF